MTTILVVDDDSVLQRTLRINLVARGHEAVVAGTGRDALALFASQTPDLIILDLGLPDIDGVDVLRTVRITSKVPVIVLSARQQADDKVEALDEGADDYVSKPFSMDELMARVRVALRHRTNDPDAPETMSSNGLVLDFAERRATRDGSAVHFTPTEWRLLTELARQAGRIVSHEDLLRAVWGPSYSREFHYLRVFANQIRRKIEPQPERPRHLINEPGVGYRLLMP